MTRIALSLAAALAFAAPAAARSDTDYPHRDWGQVATLDMSVTDATACIARELNRNGEASVIPADGGNDVDYALRVMFGKKMEPWMTFKLREHDGMATMRIFYRHPFKASGIIKQVERLQKHCLKVASITPANE